MSRLSACCATYRRAAARVKCSSSATATNAGLIGGSALLRDARVPPSLQTRAEGLGELGMGAAAAVGGGGAGPLLATGGFALLGLVAAAPCLLLFLALVGHATRRRWSAADGRLQSRHRRTLSR